MASEKVTKILVLVINYFFLIVCLISLLRMILTGADMQEKRELIECASYVLSILIASAGCYGAHKSNTCMLTTNGILYTIFSFLLLIQGIVFLVTLNPDKKVYSLILFALVAVEMEGGFRAIQLSECIKRRAKEQLSTIEVCTEE